MGGGQKDATNNLSFIRGAVLACVTRSAAVRRALVVALGVAVAAAAVVVAAAAPAAAAAAAAVVMTAADAERQCLPIVVAEAPCRC